MPINVAISNDANDAIKHQVKAATTVALPANTRTGNNYLANANGALPAIDGVTLSVGDYFLAKNEATGANNGWLKLTGLGSGGSKWTAERAEFASQSSQVKASVLTVVEQGTENADTIWILTTNNTITLNTTALSFSESGGGGSVAFADITGDATDNASLVASFQPKDATLTGLAALDASQGILVQTNQDVFAKRTIQAGSPNVVITNPSGTAGDPTFTVGGDISSSRKTGSGTYGKMYYGVSCLPSTYTTNSIAANVLNAIRVEHPDTRTIAELLTIIQANGTAANLRLGIYTDNNGYPDEMLYDSDNMAAGNGQLLEPLSLVVDGGPPVWLTILADGTITTISAINSATLLRPLGDNGSATYYTYLTVAQAYGALPNPFPEGASPQSGNPPLIKFYYSA